MEKRWKFTAYNETDAEALHMVLPINSVFCKLLVQRGVKTYDDAEKFFRPKIEYLHDPFLMKGMDIAVRRIGQAIIKKQKILIYGDYDVDGTTSTALMYSFLEKYHAGYIDYYIPDRYKEGYGVSKQGVAFAVENDFSLIVALDCGIKAIEQVASAKKQGVDFIICDHHLPEGEIPDAVAILNPKQPDCPYPYKELSGCAIGFKLAQAFALHFEIDFEEVKTLLDLVVVSLACDIVDLTGENRTLAYVGLERLNTNPRMGLEAAKTLLDRGTEYTIRDVVFGIGPMINAAGRIEHAKGAVKMLLAKDKQEAYECAQGLMLKNQERREIEAEIVQEALASVADDIAFGEKSTTVLFQPHWHKGVIGIVASKMVDEFFRPTIILTESNGQIVGSARSAGDFDIHHALEACQDLFVNFGGHTHAAGLTLEKDKLPEFKRRFEEVVAGSISEDDLKPTQYIDAEIELKIIDEKFWNILKQFAPFGPGNMRPVFVTKFIKDTGYSKLIKDKHIKLVVRQGDSDPVEGIAFNFADFFPKLSTRKPFHACYVVEENVYMGRTKLQLNIKDMRI